VLEKSTTPREYGKKEKKKKERENKDF